MAKKEKTVELKPKLDKISDEHLKSLQEKVNVVNNLQYRVGQLESQKHNLLHDLALSQKGIIEMQDVLQQEYGTFDVNVNDGTINWKEDEK
jgi:hypothetical protein|tara:strand:- start:244 stop:516 length:273 start_codon:yes stop_codon:yes gene_type:complete